jgi:protein-disulfide isomerase
MDEQENISFEGEIEKKKDWFLPMSILIAAVVIGGSIVFSTVYRGAPAPTSPQSGGTTGGGAAAVTALVKLGPRDEVLGSANAPVTIIEYGDYQCPFCTRFFTQTQSLIVSNYLNTGKVKMVFRNFPFLGPESLAAAQAAECAFDQKKLWAYHDALYQSKADDEAKGGGENDGSLNRTLFINLAQKLGLNAPNFTACLDSNKYASQIDVGKTAASGAGVNSTPSFFVNGTPVIGAQPYPAFQAAIQAALKG